ncbi:protein FAM161A isoform X2 [Onychomys torridus]|uniref:protein FAM161A isoform X2 n=1 Tax=Onychomys torridus TaxID=38674 RepID=UPI00167FB114|nr:protein FAM161A isoform X2 [Onychomys torridus]
MASPHRAARQAAASLHLPVNPTTGARVAQYEHEDPLESLVAAALAAAVEEEQKGMRPARASAAGGNGFPRENEGVTLQDVMDFSDIYRSNEEYFRKLRELKAAHAETMAKLEKMYQDKLNIKDIRPVIIREDSSSVSSGSASEKDCPQPVLLVTSFSEPEVGRSPSLSTTSEEEEPSLEREAPRGSRLTAYAKELINNMWTGFSVEDYIRHDSDFQTAKKTRKKPKTWVPTITVPVPFQMTLREQKRRGEALKARADLERDDDDVECKKKFRANPVPPCLFLPLYEDLVRQKEERRRTARERNKAALLASQKPFKFIAREEQKQAVREKQLRDLFKSKRKTKCFKARPMPHSIYRSASNDKSKEEELFRNIRMQLRAQELLKNPSWPYRPAGRPFRDSRSPGKPGGKHRCRCLSPDDGDFAENCRKEASSEHCFLNPSTLYQQCGLHESPCDSAKRQKVLADMRAVEENLKEACWPYLPPRRASPVRSPCAKPRPCLWSPPMPTLSSRGREQAIRESEKARMKEYRQELEERDEKLQKRPMLFERVAQRNARLAAEKHYSDTLKALGLSEEFVTEKGQGGKVSENVTRPEPRSHTSDKESSYEEERENEEESSLLDANSQDSHKESMGDVKESREENSEE